MPDLTIRRVILFANDVPATAAFYVKAFGLETHGDASDVEFIDMDAGACRLAIHRGAPPRNARHAPKVVFGARDIDATRQRLSDAGAKMGKVIEFEGLSFCDGADPEGNVFQISTRP